MRGAALELEHVLRPALPWRGDSDRTECGRELTGSLAVIDRAEFLDRLARLGQQRLAMTICMTCFQTAHRHRGWDTGPGEVVLRYLHFERVDRIYSSRPPARIDLELRAIAELVDQHRADFDLLLERQEWNARKAARR